MRECENKTNPWKKQCQFNRAFIMYNNMLVMTELYCHPSVSLESIPRTRSNLRRPGNTQSIIECCIFKIIKYRPHHGNVISLEGKYEKRLLKFLFVFCQVMEKGMSELTQNAEFISGGLMNFLYTLNCANYLITSKSTKYMCILTSIR